MRPRNWTILPMPVRIRVIPKARTIEVKRLTDPLSVLPDGTIAYIVLEFSLHRWYIKWEEDHYP